jgi:hypothetical protein
MSNDMEFRISARDQASQAIDTVQRKIMSFGKDIAKGLVAFAGPMALVQGAIGMISEKIEEAKKKMAEAVDFAATLKTKAGDVGISEDEFLRLNNAAIATGVSFDKLAKSYVDLKTLLESAKAGGTDFGSMLESLGFAADDIAKGLVGPIDVINRLGQAMAGAGDDTQAMAIATAVLGKDLAEKLLPALKEAKDLQEEFSQTPGLTKEEADFLRKREQDKQAEENREKLETARTEFLQSKFGGFSGLAGRDIREMDPEVAKILQSFGLTRMIKGAPGGPDIMSGVSGLSSELENNPQLRQALIDLVKRRAEAEKERLRIENEGKAQAVLEARERIDSQEAYDQLMDELIAQAQEQVKAEEDAQKKKQDADDKLQRERVKETLDAIDEEAKAREKAKEAAGKMTVSSLREIGGAMIGEGLGAPVVNYEKETLDISKRILVELEKANGKIPPSSIDFTKINQA